MTLLNIARELEAVIPVNAFLNERWDAEWLNYFLTEDPRVFLLRHDQLEIMNSMKGKSAEQIFSMHYVAERGGAKFPTLYIWVDGQHLINKNVLEIGSGPGFLGKQLGTVANRYVGIDYSKLAVHIARIVSPKNCSYYHVGEFSEIAKHAGTIDTMVGRNFFIHQNYDNLLWLLRIAHLLLKPGAIISADFHLPNPAVPQGIVHPAKHALDTTYASCAFAYKREEIDEAAHKNGFTVAQVVDRLDYQRRFALFRKPN